MTDHAITASGYFAVSGGDTVVFTGFRDHAITASGYFAVSGGDTVVFTGFRDHAIEGGGEVRVYGDGEVAISYPTTYATVGSVQLRVGGGGAYASELPPTKAVVGSGEIAVSSTGAVTVMRPFNTVGSGGIGIAGRGEIKNLPPAYTGFIGSGGVVVGNLDLPVVTVTRPSIPELNLVGSGGIEVGGGGWSGRGFPATAYYPETTDIVPTPIDVRIGGDGGASIYYPPVMALTGVGGLFIGGSGLEGIQEEDYETWVLNGIEHQPSLYSNFDFNSYCQFRGKHYAAGDDGIYLMNLDGKGDDDGVAIHPGVRLGPKNFGFDGLKFIRSLHVANAGRNTKVRTQTEDGDEDFPVARAGVFVGQRGRVGRELIIDIADFEQLNHFEVVPFVRPRR